MIQRWGLKNINEGVGYTDMDMVEDVDGMYVKYADHEALVNELMEALEYVKFSLTDETDKELRNIDFANELYEIDKAIAKAKEVS